MNRHPFRWDAIAFGLLFLAVLGQWAVWEQDWFEPDDLAYLAAAVLIVLGAVGIAGTAIGARPNRREAPFTPETSTESEPIENEPIDDEATPGGTQP
jgi:hypothetical protein